MQCTVRIEVSADRICVEGDKQYVAEVLGHELETSVRPTPGQQLAMYQYVVFQINQRFTQGSMIVVIDVRQRLVIQLGRVGHDLLDLGMLWVGRNSLNPTCMIWNASGNNAADKGLDMRSWCGILTWREYLSVRISNFSQSFMNVVEDPC
jgi:hypothetical protein